MRHSFSCNYALRPAILLFINSILVEHSGAKIRFLFTATVYVQVHYVCIHTFNSRIQSTHLHTQLFNKHPHKPSMTGQSFIQLTCKVTLPFQTVASLGSLLWVPSWHATDDVRITWKQKMFCLIKPSLVNEQNPGASDRKTPTFHDLIP